MYLHLKLFLTRLLRKDIYKPSKCYAHMYQISNPNAQCDCKIWCKYPPNGTKVYVKTKIN